MGQPTDVDEPIWHQALVQEVQTVNAVETDVQMGMQSWQRQPPAELPGNPLGPLQ